MVGHPDDDTVSRTKFRDTEGRGAIESEAERFHLRTESELADAFCAEGSGALSCAKSAVNFSDHVDVIGSPKHASNAIQQDVVLRKAFERSRHNLQPNVAQHLEFGSGLRNRAELLLEYKSRKDRDLIGSDTSGLI